MTTAVEMLAPQGRSQSLKPGMLRAHSIDPIHAIGCHHGREISAAGEQINTDLRDLPWKGPEAYLVYLNKPDARSRSVKTKDILNQKTTP